MNSRGTPEPAIKEAGVAGVVILVGLFVTLLFVSAVT